MAQPSEVDLAQQAHLQRATEYLRDAMAEVGVFVQTKGDAALSTTIQVHIEFITLRIGAVEKAVQTINRRKKDTEVEMELPNIVEEAHKLVRFLSIEKAEALAVEKQKEAVLKAAAVKAASTTETQVVIKKPPLPPMPVPKFNGSLVDYRNFLAVFNATIDSDASISGSQKLAYLKTYLEGEPAKLIGDMLITDENYRLARETLDLNYGQSTQTINLLYKQLQQVPKARSDPYSIRDTFTATENILEMLKQEGVDVDSNEFLYGILLEKWPWSLIRQLMKDDAVSMAEFRRQMRADVTLQMKLVHKTGYVPSTFVKGSKRGIDGFSEQGKQSSSSHSSAGSSTSQNQSSSSQHQGGAQQQNSSQSQSNPHQHNDRNQDAKKKKFGSASSQKQRQLACPFDGEDHYAEECSNYKTAAQRLARIPNKCKKCFRQKHDGACKSNRQCEYCPSWEHNRALCPVKYGEVDTASYFTVSDAAGAFITLIAPIQNPVTKQRVDIRVLIDPASNRTLITQEAAEKIGLKVPPGLQKNTGVGGREVEPISPTPVLLEVCPPEGEPIQIPARVTRHIADDVKIHDIAAFRKKHPRFDSCHIPPPGEGPIHMVLGTNKLVRFMTLDLSLVVNETMQLMSTKFGWVLFGEVDEPVEENPTMTFFTHTKDAVEIMQDLDILGLTHILDSEMELEERAINEFYSKLKYRPDKRYEIHWPWREYPPNLNENFGLAAGRLRSLYKKLSTTPKLLNDYNEIIKQQIEEGIVEVVPPEKIQSRGIVHYIPHHAVLTPEKSTSVRIVYDASAAVGKAKSLNKSILKGKKWLHNVVGSLLRFRKYSNAVTADIRRAFHQIAIAEEERDAVRFLWVKDISKPPEKENLAILRFTRVAFGIVASPFLLYATIHHHLQQNPMEFTEVLAREIYADNLVTSLPNGADLGSFYAKTKEVFNSMSMEMTKWKSNNQQLMQFVDVSDKIVEETTSVLGLKWNAINDVLLINHPKIDKLQKLQPTKRVALKIMASVFDPLGWMAPILLRAKLFLRELWEQSVPWDKPLQQEKRQQWNEIKNDINAVELIAYRRMYFSQEMGLAESYEIHLFVDASTVALGAVIYVRAVTNSKAEIAMVMAKTRLAPKAKLSVPRLELYAMLIGSRLLQFVVAELQIQHLHPSIIVWSDSKCVLAWVESTKMLPTVVERQLKEIRQPIVHQYCYVPSSQNPADVASRGASMEEMHEKQWITGPQWLEHVQDWPKKPIITEEDMEQVQPDILFIQGPETKKLVAPFGMRVEDFSEFQRLLRKTAYQAWALNFITQQLCRRKILSTANDVDYEVAEMLWIRWDQRRNGSGCAESVNEMTHLKRFELFLDKDGLVCCKTRLSNTASKIPQSSQIILVKKSYLTRLIVLNIHVKNCHAGTAQTLALLRERYWLTHGRREVYTILHKHCYVCKRHNAKPYTSPVVPPLPSFRVTKTSQPFQNVGIDVFGPIYVTVKLSKTESRIEKRWVLLITCLTIRAIHLEVLAAMDTMDIICALKRFTARRGSPSLIVSDNAKQFKLTDKVVNELWRDFVQDEQTSKYFAENKVTWRFIPETAPWMGGAYERMVGLVKRAFKRTYGEKALMLRDFETVIVEIEGIINNRPITYVDQEPGTVLLTPNHFLRAMYPAMPISVDESEVKIGTVTGKEVVKFWKAAETVLNEYWSHWSHQYLTELRNPSKAAKAERKPKVGDVVVMVDPSQRRGYWRTAVIERLMQSDNDGEYRAAQIRLTGGTRLIRPIVKLAPLELVNNLPVDDDVRHQAADHKRNANGAEGSAGSMASSNNCNSAEMSAGSRDDGSKKANGAEMSAGSRANTSKKANGADRSAESMVSDSDDDEYPVLQFSRKRS